MRKLTLVNLLVILVVVLAACGPQPTPEPTEAPPTEAPPAEEAAATRGGSCRYRSGGSDANPR